MLRKILLKSLISFIIASQILNIAVFAEVGTKSVSVSAECAVLIDAGSGQVVYEKNADKKQSMASTTKIMTALVALENGDIDGKVRFPKEAVGVEGSSIYAVANEEFTLRELLYALMLRSANDAAAAIAIVVGGSIEGVADMMNEKAAELGIDPATLPANPVLVRITNGVDNYTGLATALNETGVKTNSPSETAKIDASKMGDIIQYLSVGEDGDLNTAENREFIQQFTTHVVPSGEQDTVMQGNSQVSQAGVRRMQYALFHYAYNDTALLERLAESTDNNAKNITNAMVGTAGKVAKLQTEIGRGEVQDFGLQSAITNAVNLYLDAKAGKQTVDDAAGQLTMGDNGPEAQHDGHTVNLAKFMEANNRSGKQIRDFIDILVDVNMNMAAETATEVSMFDTGDQQTQEGLYDEAVTAYDQQRDGKGRIPEKSDFSQYRQYEPGKLAGRFLCL